MEATKMLGRKSRVVFSRGAALLGAIATTWVLTSCHGKVRRFSNDLEEVQTANLPAASAGEANVSGPSLANSQEGQQTPGGLDGAQLPLGTQDDGAVCLGGGDGGSCPPNLLCSADAGAVCDATCPGCLIEGECVAVDQLDPSTTCRICDPDRDPSRMVAEQWRHL